jgi:hypothetical protein
VLPVVKTVEAQMAADPTLNHDSIRDKPITVLQGGQRTSYIWVFFLSQTL